MTTCDHRLGSRTGLLCVRTDPHATGHVYHSAWLADRHDESEADDE